MINTFDIEKYYLGPLCLREHYWCGTNFSLRYVNGNASCVECTRMMGQKNYDPLKAKEYRSLKKDQISQYNHEYYLAHSLERKAYNTKYHSSLINKKRRNKKQKIKRETNLEFRLHDILKSSIYKNLKTDKKSKIKSLSYTVKDLKEHLEKYFDESMTWKNYGKSKYWTIDHLIPISWFYCQTCEDEEFKLCWSLKNLYPVKRTNNLSKLNYFAGQINKYTLSFDAFEKQLETKTIIDVCTSFWENFYNA